MDAMLKIATVMLTTAMFAGLLIVEPYGQEMGRPTLGQTQTTPSPTPSEPSPAPSVVQHDRQAGSEGERTPSSTSPQPEPQQMNKTVVSIVPSHVRTKGTRHAGNR